MADEVVKIIKIQAEDSERTVKSLKKEISDLRDALLNLDKNSEQYAKTLDKLVDDEKELTSVMKAGKNEVKAAEGSYNALQQEMTALRKVWKETANEAKRNEIGARINEINTTLKELDSSIGNNQRKVGSYEDALKTLNATFANQRQELAALKTAMDNLDPSSEAYNQAFQRAAEITHNLQERQEALKYSSADVGDQLSNINGIAANMAAGISAVNAAMGLFGSQNEDVAKALLKVQQMMALVQGLQGMDGLIKRTKGLSDAIRTWTGVQNAQTVAINATTVAQKGLNAAMKANPVGVILAALTALVALAGPIKNLFDSITGKTRRMKESVEKTNTAMKDFNESINSLDEQHRLDVIEAKIKGITQAQLRLLKIQQAQEGIDKANAEVAKIMSAIYDEFERIGHVADINVKTLQEWGLSEEQIQSLLKNTTNLVDDSAEAHMKANKNAIKHNVALQALLPSLANATSYVDNYTKAIKNLNDEQQQAAINDAERARDIDENARKSLLSQRQRLKEEYDKDIELLNKYHIDTTNRTKQYHKDLAALTKSGGKTLVTETKKTLDEISNLYQSQIQSNYGTDTRQVIKTYTEQLTTLRDFYKEMANTHAGGVKEVLEAQVKEIQSTIDKWKGTDIFSLENEAFNNSLASKLTDPQLTQERIKSETESLMKTFNATLAVALQNSQKDRSKKINDTIIELFKGTIEPSVNQNINQMQRDLDKKTVELQFQIDFGDDSQAAELELIEAQYSGITSQLLAQIDYYKQIKQFVEDNNLTPSAQYEEAIAKIEEFNTKLKEAELKRYQDIANTREAYFKNEVSETETHYDALLKTIQNTIDKENTHNGFWDSLFNSPVSVEKQMEDMNTIYETQKSGIEKLRDLWKERANDANLTNQQRIEAETELANKEMELADLVLQHEVEVQNKRAEAVQQYVDIALEGFDSIANLMGGVADAYEAITQANLEAGNITQKEADKQFDNIKKMRVAETVINTISGSIGAFLQASASYPSPWGQIIGGVAAASVTAAGVAQIAKIKATDRNGASLSSSAQATPATPTEILPMYTQNVTRESDTVNLRNALVDGMSSVNLSVSVSDIDSAQNTVKTRDQESTF